MNIYLDIIKKLSSFEELKTSIYTGSPVSLTGISGVLSSHFIFGLSDEFDKPLLIACSDEGVASRLCDDLNNMAGEIISAVYPAKEFELRGSATSSNEFEQQRLRILSKLVQKKLRIIFTSAEALLQYTIPPKELITRSTTIKSGQEIDINEMVNILSAAGYTRRDMVDGVSQFSVRGGILDFFPSGLDTPVRVEFWGDTIDTLASFDIQTQRRDENLTEVDISPASEILFDSPAVLSEKINGFLTKAISNNHKKAKQNIDELPACYQNMQKDLNKIEENFELENYDRYLFLAYEKPSSLLDYMEDAVIIVNEPQNFTESARAVTVLHNEDIKHLLEENLLCPELCTFMQNEEVLFSRIKEHKNIYFNAFPRSNQEFKPRTLVTVTAAQTTGWNGDIKLLAEDLNNLLRTKHTCVVLTPTLKGAETLTYDLHVNGIEAINGNNMTGTLQPGYAYVFHGALSGGFEYPELKFNLITQIMRTHSVKRKRKPKAREIINNLSDLNIGDYVVHVSHGIGIFNGVHQITLDNVIKDYIKIKYQGTDILYVPVTQLDLISKYIGPKEGNIVALNKLNSTGWQKAKSRVRTAVADMADELIRLYTARAKTKGFAFSEDNDWQGQFEQRFEYEETEDQLRSVDEIKSDMKKSIPMERLLCGDVGFGKTEVALRAAFKCVLDSKQCAILCPTTILAWQHFQTITRRIGNFPINIELLSRFRTPKQRKEIIQKLKTGDIDIIVGTHRVIQKDIEFKDLGLAIIDEEQRFGVAHKERFKQMFLGVDVLSLSATPIPRTLNMAMSGVRDMSVLEEAPLDRFPIQTYVIEHDTAVINDAIHRELRRGGQVYYIHNRVDTIQQAAYRLSERIPHARVGFAHGQMKEEELSKIWQDLLDHNIDILVCTTIIETGVDVANCNTLIIENADNMGLSQLYQLRGRVGRSPRRAFAYFTFAPGKQLTEIASKRLTAIREFTKFGSGFHIAMRDLEIRGAGSILGARQHGHMEAVGYDMYVRLLSEAIEERNTAAEISDNSQIYVPPKQTECLVDLQINAHIPEEYIGNLSQRMEIYRKIASVTSDEDALDVVDELIDRFGDPPSGVKGLIEIALLRFTASTLGIKEISIRGGKLLLFTDNLNMDITEKLMRKMKGRIMLNAGDKPHIAIRNNQKQAPLVLLKEVLNNAKSD